MPYHYRYFATASDLPEVYISSAKESVTIFELFIGMMGAYDGDCHGRSMVVASHRFNPRPKSIYLSRGKCSMINSVITDRPSILCSKHCKDNKYAFLLSSSIFAKEEK